MFFIKKPKKEDNFVQLINSSAFGIIKLTDLLVIIGIGFSGVLIYSGYGQIPTNILRISAGTIVAIFCIFFVQANAPNKPDD